MLLCMHIADLIGLGGETLGLKIRVRNTVWSTMAFWGQVWAFRETYACMRACVCVQRTRWRRWMERAGC